MTMLITPLANSMPASSGTNTRDFMCFFLFWLISLPAIWMPIHKVRHLFTLKAVIVPIAGLTFFIWCIVKAHGVGPIIRQPSKVHGSSLGWAMVANLMSCVSNMATLVTYAPSLASGRRAADREHVTQECPRLRVAGEKAERCIMASADSRTTGLQHRQLPRHYSEFLVAGDLWPTSVVPHHLARHVSRRQSVACY